MMSILEQRRIDALEKRIGELEAQVVELESRTYRHHLTPSADAPIAELVVVNAPPQIPYDHEWTEHRLEPARPTLRLPEKPRG